MEKEVTRFKVGLIIYLSCILLALNFALAVSPADSLLVRKMKPSNYSLPRWVMGSGGVHMAQSTAGMHSATAGQIAIGKAQQSQKILISGFWTGGAIVTEVMPIENLNLPVNYVLHQNHPNPFNAQTIIEYDLPDACKVTVEIYNSIGQRIRLVSSRVQGPGMMREQWDGCNDQGEAMGSAVFFYRVTAVRVNGGTKDLQIQFRQTKKMLLVK